MAQSVLAGQLAAAAIVKLAVAADCDASRIVTTRVGEFSDPCKAEMDTSALQLRLYPEIVPTD